MSSFTGDPKPPNAFRGQPDLENAQAGSRQLKDIHESDSQDTSELCGHDHSPRVTFNLDHNMTTPSQARRIAREERKAKEDADHAALNALLEQVTKEVRESGKSAFIPDGDRTRFEKSSPTKSIQSEDENDMRPQPLKLHNSSREMAASGQKEESLVDFLKDSEALAIIHEQQVSATAAHKAAAEMADRLKQNDTPLLSSLRRKISSTFVKDTPEQSKRVDPDSPSPLHSKSGFFRKVSNTKSNARGEGLQPISENNTASARASETDNRSSQGREEQPLLGKGSGSGYSNKGHTNLTPAPKASTHKPLLVVDTTQASHNVTPPLPNPPATKSLSAKDNMGSKQSSPSVTQPSTKSSSWFTKPKTRKWKDNDPEVKALERLILQEDFGVNKTSELTSADRKRPRTPAPTAPTAPSSSRIMSHAESAAVSYHNRLRSQSQPNSNRTPNTMQPFTQTMRKRETSNNSVESTGSVVRSPAAPHNSLGSTLSATHTFDSRASTLPSSAVRASGGTNHSVPVPSTPETSNAGGSLRFPLKEVGSGYSHENFSSLSASPTSHTAGVAGYPRTSEHSSSTFQSPVKQGIGRSFTDPYDGKASIGSIHTMSSHEDPSADFNANQLPRPLRRMAGRSLEGPSGMTNTSSDTASYELDVLQSRGHGSNEFITHPNTLPGAMLPISQTGDPAVQSNQPRSGVYEQGAHSTCTSSAQANSQASIVIPGNVSGPSYPTTTGTLPATLVSSSGSPRPNFQDVQGTPASVWSPSHLSSSTVIRDFQNLQAAGGPSNRLQLEEDAENDRRRRRMTKQNYVAFRLHLLRKRTKTEINSWDGHDTYPRHPNHGRTFLSANLWCNQCTENCARCNAPCCAFKAAAITVMSGSAHPSQKAGAVDLADEIQMWLSTGVDNMTFMDCTECKQFVCPTCTSICPVEPCCDRLCIACNPDNFWQPCDWHTPEEITQAFVRQRERMLPRLISC